MKAKPLTDDDLMPWGDHKGTPMRDVPLTYLAWLSNQAWIKDRPEAYGYIQTKREAIAAARDDITEEQADPEAFGTYEDYERDARGF